LGRFDVSSLHIHWLHLAALNTLLLCGFMLIVGWFAPATPAAASAKRDGLPSDVAVDLTPWRGLRVASVVVSVLAVVLYFSLWRLAHSG
jgi:uncharacterized sodium:solute symporter family permease YidK